MNYTVYFIDAIKEYMERNNLTMTEFAQAAGITEGCLSKWIEGKGYPSLNYLIKIADFIDCSLDFLVGRAQTPGYTRSVKNQTFCERLDFLLAQQEESFYRVAKTCKFGASIYAKWKKGKKPKPEKLILLSKHFNVSLDFLIGRSDFV